MMTTRLELFIGTGTTTHQLRRNRQIEMLILSFLAKVVY
jgi:hypothetical protein